MKPKLGGSEAGNIPLPSARLDELTPVIPLRLWGVIDLKAETVCTTGLVEHLQMHPRTAISDPSGSLIFRKSGRLVLGGI